MAKQTKTKVIVEELLVGGTSVEEIRDRVIKKIPEAKPESIVAQIKGVLANIKSAKISRWQQYKLVDGKIAIQAI